MTYYGPGQSRLTSVSHFERGSVCKTGGHEKAQKAEKLRYTPPAQGGNLDQPFTKAPYLASFFYPGSPGELNK